MADENIDWKAAKAAAKEAKRREKLKKKGIDPDDPHAEDYEGGIGSKIAVFFATLIIIALWLAIFVLIVKWDVGGFGSKVMYPVVKDVPVLNMILPEVKEKEEDPDHDYTTLDEAVGYIKQLELELAQAQEKINAKNERIEKLKTRIERLSAYEDKIEEFEALKEKFDREVVFSSEAPDISNYREYYESIDPENAESLYKQVVRIQQLDEELAEYVKAYSGMKPKDAAEIFDTMTEDLSLVAKILENMDADSRGSIIGQMTPEIAARVTEIMDPD